MQQPNVPMALARAEGLALHRMETSYFLSRESFIPSRRPDLARWQEWVFQVLTNAAADATNFFRLPPNRVVELGAQVEI
jgi:KUP system potassium uptake protein